MENVLELIDLCKKYNKFELMDVSIKIPEGCVAGFIGLNGQGKTTTIRTMLGLSKKNSGTVKILGMDFDDNEKEIKDRIGIVFDEGYLYDGLKIKDMKNIVSNSYSRWDDVQYRKYMKKFNLDENQTISTLSKGMKMKFALTLALSHNAEFLIMDEPTSGLDPLVRKELLNILADFMESGGKGVLYSTHITSDLDRFADIIIFIDNGKIIFSEDKDYLLDTYVRVKGNNKYINDSVKRYFTSLEIGEYSFMGITKESGALKKLIPDMVIEKIVVEDLMLAFVEGKIGKTEVDKKIY